MELVKLFCMTKDEYDLIEDFIRYHGNIFGYNNIIIIDNMSTNPIVLDVYDRYEKLGVTIVKEPSYVGQKQGEAFTKNMLNYKDKCKWLIGLDTDEFMAPVDESEDLISILKNIPNHVKLCKISNYLFSIVDTTISEYVNYKVNYPARSITSFYFHADPRKVFYRSNSFVETACGNHFGVIEGTEDEKSFVPIKYFHFNNTGCARKIERARTIVEGYEYINDKQTISEQLDILTNLRREVNGKHRVQEYRMFLVKSFLIDMFKKYIKRIPKFKELEEHAVNKFNKNFSALQIEEQFKNSAECLKNVNIPIPSISDEERNKLLYFDALVPSSGIIHSTYIRDLLK